jgi:Endonuclease/Exonuclease/phosphatase family.
MKYNAAGDEDGLNLLFWNLGKNDNCHFLSHIINENKIDLAIVAEYLSTDMSSVISDLHGDYCLCNGNKGCDKVTLLFKKGIKAVVRQEQTRYTLYSCDIDKSSYIIAGIHLPSNPNANAEDRKNVIRELVSDVCVLEKEMKHNNTIIIGDFNASPFDNELIQKDAFNAVLYKKLIEKAEYVTSGRNRYRRFYNPIINYISESSSNYGSFYYGSKIDSLYWYCYDQILVRKPLIDLITRINYCKEISNKSLLNSCKPKKNISDHLPLLVCFERKV